MHCADDTGAPARFCKEVAPRARQKVCARAGAHLQAGRGGQAARGAYVACAQHGVHTLQHACGVRARTWDPGRAGRQPQGGRVEVIVIEGFELLSFWARARARARVADKVSARVERALLHASGQQVGPGAGAGG